MVVVAGTATEGVTAVVVAMAPMAAAEAVMAETQGSRESHGCSCSMEGRT